MDIININKYRKMSAFANNGGNSDYERKMVLQQAINEFDIYQLYSPNTHRVYINDNPIPILATFQDVSDLEVRADTKWMATSLQNKVFAGDIITWNINGKYTFDANGKPIGKKWLVIYDKEKNTANSYKVKIQPCNYAIKLPYFNNGVPDLYIADSIIMTYLTDTKDFKQPFPTESGTTFISVPFNDITSRVDRNDRIWLYTDAFQVTGVDFTNIDFYIGKGFLKWTLRPCNESSDLDREDLKICDYYKFFPKDVVVTNPVVYPITLTATKTKVGVNTSINITSNTDNVAFVFDGNNLNCTLTNTTNNSCTLNTNKNVGIVYVKAYLKSDPSQVAKLRFIITNEW